MLFLEECQMAIGGFCILTLQIYIVVIYTVACESLGTPCRICENVNNFNKIREIIQNACYFYSVFS